MDDLKAMGGMPGKCPNQPHVLKLHPDDPRNTPSMEACGIDAFKILENAGYDPAVLKDYINTFVLFDMVFGLKSFLNPRFCMSNSE